MKQYLGDSVYAEMKDDFLVLTTENGYEPSNTIYLEPQVLESLLRYIRSRNDRITEDQCVS